MNLCLISNWTQVILILTSQYQKTLSEYLQQDNNEQMNN